MISVILPVYNASLSVSRAINSVLSQTHSNFELIIINDGSTDDTLSVINEIASQDIRINVLSQSNSGANAARKLGVESSHGEYVTFIDADDTLEVNGLKSMIDQIKDCDVLITRAKLDAIFNKDSYLSTTLDHLLPKELWGKLYKRNLLTDWVMDVPRDVSVGEDFIWNIRISNYVNKVCCVQANYYQYDTQVEGSIMNTFKKDLNKEITFYNLVEATLNDMGFSENEIYKLMTAQRFYSFFGIVRDLPHVNSNDSFLRKVGQSNKYLRYKVNIVLYSIMCISNINIKMKLLRLYISARGL